MRIGVNPEMNKEIRSDAYHRIIIPVYVPHLNDYFEKGLEFTKMCLESVIRTRHAKSRITIVNNGSCREISDYLHELFDRGSIDQLILQKENIGKIDAMMQIAKTAPEPLITLSDGDVLFLDGWIQATEEVFCAFPEAGMVSPVPHGTTYGQYSTNTLFDAFFKGLLKFQSVSDPEDMKRFAASIGRSETMYDKPVRLKYQLTVKREGFAAVVGCGHFVATMRKEVFEHAPRSNSKMAYASNADRNYIDFPNEKAKLWRLASATNYAYHIGNNPQDWMYKKFEAIVGNKNETIELRASITWNIPLSIKRFINRLWLNKLIRPYMFKRLGLKEGFNDY